MTTCNCVVVIQLLPACCTVSEFFRLRC